MALDTVAERIAASRFALVDHGTRKPSGTATEVERGYTLGLYPFTTPAWSYSQRESAIKFGLGGCSIRKPVGYSTSQNRSHTLGLYTFEDTIPAIYWTIDFTGNSCAGGLSVTTTTGGLSVVELTGGLSVTCATGGLAVTTATGGLSWIASTLPALPSNTGFIVTSAGEYLVDSNGDYLIVNV